MPPLRRKDGAGDEGQLRWSHHCQFPDAPPSDVVSTVPPALIDGGG